MQFDFRHDLDALKRRLEATAARQIPFAASLAINRVAAGVRGQEMALMPAELDRPTPFTMRAVKYTKATKQSLTAVVYLDTIQSAYLGWQIEGGTRKPRRKAIGVPTTKAKRNSYGNLPKGTVSRLLADKRNYFSGKPKGGNKPAGIWKRTKQGLIPIVLWTDKAAYKEKRFDFYGHGARFIERHWQAEMNRAIEDALRSATR